MFTTDSSERECTASNQTGRCVGMPIIIKLRVPPPTSSTGAVYLKNYIHKYWKAREPSEEEPVPYIIPDSPKALIRDNIVEAIIQTPHLIR